MTAEEWIAAYAARLGVQPPASDDVQQLLALAGIAAHASERQAAPVSCWIAATAGISAEQALSAARELELAHRREPEQSG